MAQKNHSRSSGDAYSLRHISRGISVEARLPGAQRFPQEVNLALSADIRTHLGGCWILYDVPRLPPAEGEGLWLPSHGLALPPQGESTSIKSFGENIPSIHTPAHSPTLCHLVETEIGPAQMHCLAVTC